MTNRQPLSKGEMEIVRVVWELKEASVGDVFDAIAAQRDLDYTTVQTYIRRLEAKGYLQSRRAGRNKLYRPKVRPAKVIGEVVDDLLRRLFDGELIPLMRHLISEREVTSEELAQLRRLLDEETSSNIPDSKGPKSKGDHHADPTQ